MMKVTLSELKSRPGKYVEIAAGEETVYITKRGRSIAKIVTTTPDIMSLIGFLPSDVDLDKNRDERLKEKTQ